MPVMLTIVAFPGPAQDLVSRLLGGDFIGATMVLRLAYEGEAQSVIRDLGRAAGTRFNVVVEPSADGRHIFVRVTEASGARSAPPPPRPRASREFYEGGPRPRRTRSAPPPPLHRVDEDEAQRQRYAKFEEEADADIPRWQREQDRQRDAKFAQDRADDARRDEENRRRVEESHRRAEEARRRTDDRRHAEEEARTRRAEAKERWRAPADPARAKIIDRIKKLLRLATHPTTPKHEAANAKEGAATLMQEHGIRADDVRDLWRRNGRRR